MVVADSEAPQLKQWVIDHINFKTEADPETLSEYIIALLQHDEPIETLGNMCIEALNEFLLGNTIPFVSSLLEAYESKSYLKPERKLERKPERYTIKRESDDFGSRLDTSNDLASRLDTSTAGRGNHGSYNNNGRHRHDDYNSGKKQAKISFRNGRNIRAGSDFGSGASSNQHQFAKNDDAGGGDDKGNKQIQDYDTSFKQAAVGFNMEAIPWPQSGFGFSMPPFLPDQILQASNSNTNRNSYSNGSGNGGRNGINNWGFDNRSNRNNKFQNSNRNGNRKRQGLNQIATTQPDTAFTNKKLVIEKIPEEKFNQESLQDYFSQFGHVEKIVLDPHHHLAELEFATHHEARSAWASPAPIFGNRFVKVYWRRQEDSHDEGEPQIDVEAVKQVQAQKQKEWEEKLAKKQENNKKLKELLDKKAALIKMQKEQQELLLKHALQSGNAKYADTESSQTQTLEAQLESLKREAQLLGLPQSGASPSSSYRGGYRGHGSRGRGGYSNHYSPYSRPYGARGGGFLETSRYNLDLRPKTVSVKPVPAGKEEALRGYFMSMGEYVETSRLKDVADTIAVTFKSRKSAEQFYYGSSNIPDLGPIEKAWCSNPVATETPEAAGSTPSSDQAADATMGEV